MLSDDISSKKEGEKRTDLFYQNLLTESQGAEMQYGEIIHTGFERTSY